MIGKILGVIMFIQKNSGLLNNNTARNMTQNKLRSPRSYGQTRWVLSVSKFVNYRRSDYCSWGVGFGAE